MAGESATRRKGWPGNATSLSRELARIAPNLCSATMATMVQDLRSGRFDLLLTGYSDRWQRNLRRTLELLEDELHPNGVALVMCDRKILSSDPSDWDELISEAAGAEKYSRRLSERITEGYAAKFDQEHGPGGHAGLGFRRLPEPPHTLQIDPDRMPIAVGLFERYALGNVSAAQLEVETGLAATRIRMILMNPLYGGWIRRHRGEDETRRRAPWRAKPPASDELWSRVEEVRRAKARGGGPKNWDRVDLLGGLLECVCAECVGGRLVRNDGTFADGRHRKLHAAPGEAWGRKARLGDETWEGPVPAQVAGIAVDDVTMASVVATLGSNQHSVTIDRARIDRQIRESAPEHAGGPLADDAYLTRLTALREQRDALMERTATGLSGRRAVEWSRALGETVQHSDVPAEKADLMHAIYERITVAGPTSSVSGLPRRPTPMGWRLPCPKRL